MSDPGSSRPLHTCVTTLEQCPSGSYPFPFPAAPRGRRQCACGWPWPWRGVRRGAPGPRMRRASQAMVKSCVLCWASPPPGKSLCGAVGLSRPHTAAGHHMRGASSPGITEPREPWGGGRSTRAVALSSLPCLAPPFMSASLATLSFPPPPLLSLHLASFPCLPPTPSPLHLAVLAASAPLLCVPPPGPCAFIPRPQPPAPTSPALAACPSPAVPLCDLPPHPQTSHRFGGKEGVAQAKSPLEFSLLHPKSFPPFLPSFPLSPPGCL